MPTGRRENRVVEDEEAGGGFLSRILFRAATSRRRAGTIALAATLSVDALDSGLAASFDPMSRVVAGAALSVFSAWGAEGCARSVGSLSRTASAGRLA